MLNFLLKTGLRSFRKNKAFSLINISGLAIGISAALVIYLIVDHEFSYDKFHRDGDRIYRVTSTIYYPDLVIKNGGVPVPTYKAVKEEVTGLEASTHFTTAYESKVTIPSESPAVYRRQKSIIYADNHFFSLFEYGFLAGSASGLSEPFRVIVSESRAKRYFGNIPYPDMIGRTIIYNDSVTVTVAGVVKEFTQNSDLHFKEFISRSTIEHTGLKNHHAWEEWGSINSNSQLFVKLSPGTAPEQIKKQLVSIREKYRDKSRSKPGDKDDTVHDLQALGDIHFNADFTSFEERHAHKPTLYGLLAVAAFILLLGCINFINLTTAQSAQRAREIGIRKTMGSRKSQLILQFLTETFLLTCAAAILSLVFSPWLLQVFSDFIPPGIGMGDINQIHVWLFLITLTIVVTFIAGTYPAFILTRFKPVSVMKNQAYTGTAQTRKAWLRKSLTVMQFIIAQFLVIATLVVAKQIHYSMNKDLGYEREAIVSVNTVWNFFSDKKDNRRFVFLEKLKALPGIEKISLSGSAPASGNTSSTTMKFKKGDELKETMVEVKYADSSYFDLYGMKLVAGRNLQNSDTTKEYIINETYARFLGFSNPADAVGQFIERDFNVPVVGVIRDFHTKSTQQEIKPLAYSSAASRSYTVHLKLRDDHKNPKEMKKTLAGVETIYKEVYPEEDYNQEFFDESIASFYKDEQNIARLLKWAAGICIFISCLGLLGLVMYTTTQRTKEIGVRKVLGASVMQILALLSKDLLTLVLLAFVIAAPLAWYFMNEWLQDYSYRTSFSWWIFAVTVAGMLLIAILTLSIRTIRSAQANPVDSLRSE